MTKSKDVKFSVAGRSFSASGVEAVVPTETGCEIRWIDGRSERLDNITSTEVLFKIDDAKASTDSH